ncbi:19377_t:CDS:2, partial [Rhizophagus irregularis]
MARQKNTNSNEKVLSSILSRIAALEKENKELKNEANKRVEKDSKNVQKNVKKCVLEVSDQSSSEESDNIEDEEDINESGQIITTPIPKPLVGKGQFANLHLNLNLEKS